MFGWQDNYAYLQEVVVSTIYREQYKGGLKLLEGVTSDSLIVGLRRSVKAIENGEAEKAIVATDIAPSIFDDFTIDFVNLNLKQLKREHNINITPYCITKLVRKLSAKTENKQGADYCCARQINVKVITNGNHFFMVC